MRRHFLFLGAAAALLCLLLVPGCDSEMETAAGTYALDKDGVKESIRAKGEAEGVSTQEVNMALAMIDEMSMQMTLNADGTATTSTSMMGQTQSASGTWTISDGTVTVTMAEEGSDGQSITGKLSGDSLEMEPAPDSEMPFKMVFKKRAM